MRFFLLGTVLSVLALPVYAQRFCQDTLPVRTDTSGLRRVAAKVACAGTMYVYSETGQKKIINDRTVIIAMRNRLRDIDSMNKDLVLTYRQRKNEQDDYVAKLEAHIALRDKQVDSLRSIASKSLNNADEALSIAKKNRVLGKIGAGIGLLGTLAILVVAFK